MEYMARRIAILIFLGGLLLPARGLYAQQNAWNQGTHSPGWLPAFLSFKRSGHPARVQYGGATAPAEPVRYATPQTAIPGAPYYGKAGLVTQRVSPQREWIEPSPLEAMLSQVFHRSWYRLEYLLWNIDAPRGSGAILGAPLQSVPDLSSSFPVFDLQIPPNQIGLAAVPNLGDISFRDTNGIRGTLGVETSFGSIEANVFAMEQADDRFDVPGLRPQIEITDAFGVLIDIIPGRFAATSLLSNGQPSDLVELYNQSFSVSYESDIFGAEANLLFSNIIHLGFPLGVEIQPLFGFRYLLIQEQMRQVGQFQDITGQAPLLTSIIDSDTSNNLFGPTIGLRAEYPHPWFTIGVESKVTLATNAYRARVRTEQFRLAADPTVQTMDRSTFFSPIGEVQTYARIRVTENINVTVGYSLIYVTKLTRPHNNIFYNDNGAFPTPPGIVLKPSSTDLKIEGLTFGIDILLP